MLIRTTDPFRDLDRVAQQLLGTTNRPASMPMDAWREGDTFIIEFDLPGISRDSIDLDVERNVLTVRAERVRRNGDWQMLANERGTGTFTRQLVLGDNVDLDHVGPATTPECSASRCPSRSGPSRARSSSPTHTRSRPRSTPDPRARRDRAAAGPRPSAARLA